MAAEDDGVKPSVGDWYVDTRSGDRFRLLAIEDARSRSNMSMEI